MYDDLCYRMLGFVLIFLGFGVFSDPIIEGSSRHPVDIDLTGINIQVGLILIGIGCFFIWSTYRKK